MQAKRKRSAAFKIWLLATVGAAIIVGGGIVAWNGGFQKQATLEAEYANATAIARGQITPVLSETSLAELYNSGIAQATAKNYPGTIATFQKLVNYRPGYKDAAARLLISLTEFARAQAKDVTNLTTAPATYQTALDLISQHPNEIKHGFEQSPELLNTGTYQSLADQLQSEQQWATQYARGHSVVIGPNGWWDNALKEWEPLYQANPDYLKDNPALAASRFGRAGFALDMRTGRCFCPQLA